MTLPPWDGERDLTDPFAYPPRPRTPQNATRPAGPSVLVQRRRARIAALVTVAAGGVVALVVCAGVVIANRLHTFYAQPVATSGTIPGQEAPVATPSPHDITAMMTPDGWSRRASTGSGALAFAYDPSWTDVMDSPEDRQFQEEALAAAGDSPQDAVVLLGDWQRAASATMPAVRIRVVEDPVGGRDGDIRTIVERYTSGIAADLGDDEPDSFSSGYYRHPLGYEGFQKETWAHVDGQTIAIVVTGLRYRDAVVFASMTTDGYLVPIDAVPGSVVFLP